MSHRALMDYVHQARLAGASDTQIADRLHGAGWYRVDIQDALELHRKIMPRQDDIQVTLASMPDNTERLAPHTYDPRLIAVAAGSFAIGFVVYLLLTK